MPEVTYDEEECAEERSPLALLVESSLGLGLVALDITTDRSPADKYRTTSDGKGTDVSHTLRKIV
jgi:hypothetical protein